MDFFGYLMNIPLVLYLLFIVAPIGTFIHELGHALGAVLAKADTVILSIGSGKKTFQFSIKKIQIKIHNLFFIGGYIESERKLSYKNRDICLIAILGPMLNIIIAAVLFFIQKNVVNNDFIYILFLFNIWLALINIIPFKIGDKYSDGYTILRAIMKHRL